MLRRRAALAVMLVASSATFLVAGPDGAKAWYTSCNWSDNLGCLPDPPLSPPASCNSSNIPMGHVPVVITGRVLGPSGEGIPSACVYWAYGAASTDSAGTYRLTIWADASVTVYAYKTRYTWNSLSLTPETIATADKDLRLSFLHTTNSTPFAFANAPTTSVAFSMLTTAPPLESRILLHLPDGEITSLTQDFAYSGAPGWTKWHVTRPIDSRPDGKYYYSSCVLGVESTGDCYASNGRVLSGVERPGTLPFIIVDSVAPQTGPGSPLDGHDTVSRKPLISQVASDALSGIDASASELSLDGGAPVKGLSFVPTSDLTNGLHTVTATAVDYAGNLAVASWRFAVVSLTTEDATVTLDPALSLPTPVNPNNQIPPPSSVHFNEVSFDVASYRVSLSGPTIATGSGRFLRYFSPMGAAAVFNNGAGSELSVPLQLPPVADWSGFAALIPFQGPTAATIQQHKISAGPLDVTVPSGYNLPGSTVRLQVASGNRESGSPNQVSSCPGVNDPLGCSLSSLSPVTIQVREEVTRSNGTWAAASSGMSFVVCAPSPPSPGCNYVTVLVPDPFDIGAPIHSTSTNKAQGRLVVAKPDATPSVVLRTSNFLNPFGYQNLVEGFTSAVVATPSSSNPATLSFALQDSLASFRTACATTGAVSLYAEWLQHTLSWQGSSAPSAIPATATDRVTNLTGGVLITPVEPIRENYPDGPSRVASLTSNLEGSSVPIVINDAPTSSSPFTNDVGVWTKNIGNNLHLGAWYQWAPSPQSLTSGWEYRSGIVTDPEGRPITSSPTDHSTDALLQQSVTLVDAERLPIQDNNELLRTIYEFRDVPTSSTVSWQIDHTFHLLYESSNCQG